MGRKIYRIWRSTARIGKSERGVAILLVMTSVLMLTAVIVDFAFRANVGYHLALNYADRLQAYYLAESGLQFSRLLIKFDRELRERAKKEGVDVDAEPLYRMFPLSSSILRATTGGETAPSEADGAETEAEGGGDFSILEEKAAEDFLGFNGDFDLEIVEEEAKFDLNVFATVKPGDPDYDPRKRWLIALLRSKEFKSDFEDREDGLQASEWVYRVADWVDANETVEELEGRSGGSEGGVYEELDYGPKNGKMASGEELGLVAGTTPRMMAKLLPLVTPYSVSHKWAACLADEELVRAFVVMNSEVNTCTSPLDPESDAEQIDALVEAFLGGCPEPQAMADSLHEAMGLGTEEGAEGACGPLKLADLLSDSREIFTVVGRGVVGDTTIEVRTVLDARAKDPKQWRFIYWRVN